MIARSLIQGIPSLSALQQKPHSNDGHDRLLIVHLSQTGSNHVSSKKAEIERLYEELYRSHQQAAKEAALRGEDYEQYLLEEYDLRVFQHPETLEPLPAPIRVAYAPYAENPAYWARLCKVPYEDTHTFAICVTTDGDDGYLEIYSQEGASISVGRTYLELIGWCSLDEIRYLSRPDVLAYPASLEDRMERTLWNSGR